MNNPPISNRGVRFVKMTKSIPPNPIGTKGLKDFKGVSLLDNNCVTFLIDWRLNDE